MKPKVVFLHGLESGPHGSKYQALRHLDPELVSPDCTGIANLDERLEIIEDCLAQVERMVIVGSSFGGLAAVMFAQKPCNFSRITGCLLCAPALTRLSSDAITTLPPGTIILHGTRDEVIPIQTSRDFSKQYGISLMEVDDDHRLSDSSDLMLRLAADLLRPEEVADESPSSGS